MMVASSSTVFPLPGGDLRLMANTYSHQPITAA